MAEYIDIDQPLIFKDIHNRDVTGTIRTILKANHTELVFADVIPVVRCKDCKHGTRLVCGLAGNEYIECRHGNVPHRLDWFCADGAKMDKEEE